MTQQEALNELVPKHIHGGILRYIHEGIEPGDFLYSIITNDLRGSFGRADHINKPRIGDILMFFYNYAPGICWGSPEKVEAWIERFNEASDANPA